MAEAKTIKLLLSNGSLAGALIAELSKWEGILLSSPRQSYEKLSYEKESKFWGIYLLISESKVYIGQTNDLLKRISTHDKNKDWWDKVVLLTNKDNSLDETAINYLERELITKATKAGTLEIDNSQSGNASNPNRYKKAELDDYLEGALLLIELIGIKVFSTQNILENNLILLKSNIIINEMLNKNEILKTMNKSHAINLFKNRGNLNQVNFLTFASLQKNKKPQTFWANSDKSCLNKDWNIILNNQEKRELYLLSIPKNTLTIRKDDNKGIFIRNDKEQLDLNIIVDSFIDLRSRVNFREFIIDKMEY